MACCGSFDSQVMVWQDWWGEVKNQLDKPDLDAKKTKQLCEEMTGWFGDSKSPGLGSFRRKFIQVHNFLSSYTCVQYLNNIKFTKPAIELNVCDAYFE